MRASGWAVTFVPVFLAIGCGPSEPERAATEQPASPSRPAAAEASSLAFRNAASPPPAGWNGPTFTLSHNYPATDPGKCPKNVCTWLDLKVDFNPTFTGAGPSWKGSVWEDYLGRILAYVKEGQDPQLADNVGFRVEVGGKTRWFHVPWMAYDPTVGRDFVHGTTNERTAHLSDLLGQGNGFGVHRLAGTSAQCLAEYPHGFETWSVGFYNEWGGWAVGQAFPASGRLVTAAFGGSQMPAGLPFAEGTVVTKVLTTNAPVSCVSYLRGSPEWQVDRHTMDPTSHKYKCERQVQTSRIVQVDVAVVDSRSPTRWVYGTFAYDGRIKGDTFWDRLAPVGVQWGNDPWTFPAVPKADSIPARQSVLNRDLGIYAHYGCNGRLAGPVDNEQSSCLSCHGSAFALPNVPSTMGFNTPNTFGFDDLCTQYSQENVAYFQNLTPPQSYPNGRFPQAMSLDTSLQMWVALQQYGQFNTAGQPVACKNPDQF
jgi:hypothetical protein